MWLKAQNETAGLWLHAAMGPVERMVRRQWRYVWMRFFGPSSLLSMEPAQLLGW
jgi:hypothetical protein